MMQHQSPEYDSVPAESILLVSRFKWRVVLAGLLLTIVGGMGLTFALLQGLGDPTYAPRLVVDLTSDEGLEVVSAPNVVQVSPLSTDELPITIEVMGSVGGSPSAIWGIWIQSENLLYLFQITADGYFSAIPSGWQEFIHLQPVENKLYLHIEADGNAIFRINDEIAWTGLLSPEVTAWGLVRALRSPIAWHYIRMFAG